MAKLSLIVLTVCLIAATLDGAQGVCSCSVVASTDCTALQEYLSCLRSVDSSCKVGELTAAQASIGVLKTTMTLLGCSGVSGLMSSFSLVLALCGIAYLMTNKEK